MDLSKISLFSSHRNNYLPALKIYSRRVSTSHLLPKLSRVLNKLLYRFFCGSALNRYDNSFTLYSSFADKGLYKEYDSLSIFCNFGSGGFYHPKWRNYDYPGQSKYYQSIQGEDGIDFFAINLCDSPLKLQEADNSVTLIYCSHTLEHLGTKAATDFLAECFRILKPNGVLRVALPNTEYDFYINRVIDDYRDGLGERIKDIFLRHATTHLITDSKSIDLDIIKRFAKDNDFKANQIFSAIQEFDPNYTLFNEGNPERHICFWGHETLIQATKKMGFRYCLPMLQGSSIAPPFTNINIFDNTEPHTAIFFDVVK